MVFRACATLLVLFVIETLSSTFEDSVNSTSTGVQEDLYREPEPTPLPVSVPFRGVGFQNNSQVNISVQLGSTAFLRCKVFHAADKTVFWIRSSDLHILTSGLQSFTLDERFQVLHRDGSSEWILQIKFVQPRDQGQYVCQVSSPGGVSSLFVNLEVYHPEAVIEGSHEYHVDIGSKINLACVIEKSLKPPDYVWWFHDKENLNYDHRREDMKIVTEPGERTTSKLRIGSAKFTDSGNYTCVAPNTKPASVNIFVSEGDKMAAILRRKASSSVKPVASYLFVYTLACHFMINR